MFFHWLAYPVSRLKKSTGTHFVAHILSHIITTVHVLNGFQQVQVVVLCVNNVIQSQVNKCVNFDKVCVLIRVFLALEYRAVCVDKHTKSPRTSRTWDDPQVISD